MDYQYYKSLQLQEINRLEKLADYYYQAIPDDDKALQNYLKVSNQKMKILDYRLIRLMEKYEKRIAIETNLAGYIATLFINHFPGTPENRAKFGAFIDDVLEKINQVENQLKSNDVDISYLENIRHQCFYQNDDLTLPND